MKKINKIDVDPGDSESSKNLHALKEHFIKKKPSFEDKVSTLLDECIPDNDKKKYWRNFFRAITVLRNKSSHEDTSLSQIDKESLINAEFGFMISGDQLTINFTDFSTICNRALNFYNEVAQKN